MEFDELYAKAQEVTAFRKLSIYASAGQVGAAILSDTGKVYTGVCIDMACSVGFCAEHAAAAAMVTAGESKIAKVIAVGGDGRIMPPCGRCREFMNQLHNENGEAEVQIAPDVVVKLKDLLPYDWR